MAEENQREDEDDTGVSEEGEGADGEEEGAGGGLNAKKIVLIVVLPLFLLLGAGGGLYFSGMLDSVLGGGSEEEQTADAGHGDEGGHGGGHGGEHGAKGNATGAHFLEIPNMTVNIQDTGGQTRYLRLTVQLELASEEDRAGVEAVMPRVVDQFQTYLRELHVRDLRGSAGIYRLQMELLSRVNAAAYPIEVKDVLFQEILIQ